jgi:hypothetical protein
MKPKFTILLSASVPTRERSEEFRKIANAQLQIERAVIALARNVFEAGGRLIFGGHPSISPLVMTVAMEYGEQINKDIESLGRNELQSKLINIYQSRAFEDVIAEQTISLLNLGFAHIIWTDAIDEEKCDPKINKKPQCLKSLKFMREQMIDQNIDALVCIGGMEGVIEEFALFRKRHPAKPVFVFKTTGGASAVLAREYSNLNNLKVIDRTGYISDNTNHKELDESEKIEIIPYTFYTALIVKDLSERSNY